MFYPVISKKDLLWKDNIQRNSSLVYGIMFIDATDIQLILYSEIEQSNSNSLKH